MEIIEYHGHIFRRNPAAKSVSDRNYFRAMVGGGGNCGRRCIYLHRLVWENAHGPVPEGHHIHHRDGNHSNNALANLECVDAFDHLSQHTKERWEDPAFRTKQCANLERIRPLAAEWHSSEEGRAWHSEHGREVMANRQPLDCKCRQCKAGYSTKSRRKDGFCSNNCKSQFRRESGVDDISRNCSQCKKPFMANKYSQKHLCSRACSGDYRRGRPQNRLRADDPRPG